MVSEPVHRACGLETEFGVLHPADPYANAVAMSAGVVAAYAALSRPGLVGADGAPAPAVRWDYEGEDPLADLRGGRLERAGAHPSMLTDDPTRPAPSGPGSLEDLPAAPWGARPRPSEAEAALPRATTAVLANGARLYVDHAHPEYSSPEVLTPLDALTWDRAGEVIARCAMTALRQGADGAPAQEVVLYKNNVDGKGAAYGSHESYLVRRDLPFDLLAAALTPFLVTRPVIAGAGRVGIGQHSERAGFQISQRADYVQTDVGLQTTFNRPIVNTRDEPHADAARWRRLHVINGDANRLDVPVYLKVATTSLLLWYLERAHARGEDLSTLTGLADLRLVGDPVEEHWALSHDTSLTHELATACGPLSALAVQRRYLGLVRAAVEDEEQAGTITGPDTRAALALWEEVLDGLEAYAACLGTPQEAAATAAVARDVEWVAKKQLCEALRARTATGWDDARLAALDIQWADLRAGKGVADRLIAAGRTRRLVTDAEVEHAADTPPSGTRAAVRGRAVAGTAEVVAASWTSLVLDVPGRPGLLRLALPEVVCDEDRARELLAVLRAAARPTDH
ncbi:proteasome accessory factor PafA2 family protein [Actinomyces sp. W5033]|uniref:proteasome accessory factor PafA2 family protein n=1 Tax=Actinomyces sp. W5033 TaxID=3446479 RepID=UPI003EE072ED